MKSDIEGAIGKYLTENLSVSIDHNTWDGIVTVTLKLGSKVISEDYFTIPEND